MLKVVDHALAQKELTVLRDRGTNSIAFRKGLVHLGSYMGYEIAGGMEKVAREVETPLSTALGYDVPDMDRVVIINVLRAAIPLVEGLIKNFPNARVGIISAWRGEAPKFEIEVNYVKFPTIGRDDMVIIADPMLATGNTFRRIVGEVKKRANPRKIVLVSVIAYRGAVEKLQEIDPALDIYTVAVDPELNDEGYIIPGLGDAGDRAFGKPDPD
jgi:uracil phosphoribosyltransferase